MELIIDRNTWLRGEDSHRSFLLRSDDCKKCCVGFLALQLGLAKEQITGISALHNSTLADTLPSDWKIDARSNTEKKNALTALYVINDCPVGSSCNHLERHEGMTEEKREQLITKYFAGIGITTIFIN